MQPNIKYQNSVEKGFNNLKLNILSQKYNHTLLEYFLQTKQSSNAQGLVKDVLNTVIEEIDLCTQTINLDAMVFRVAKGMG